MDLKIAWWNCHISAPATKAKPGVVTDEFILIVLAVLDSGVDLFCLCEVNESDCLELARKIEIAAHHEPRYADFTLLSLYAKDGNKIDDYGIIYRHNKLSPVGDAVDLNAKADVTDKHLKVGRKLGFKLDGSLDLWVILCHWQSLRTYAEDSHIRSEVAMVLRGYVEDIYDQDGDALIAICGDFNDEPFSRTLQMALKASRDISYVKARSKALFNPFWRLVGITDLVAGSHLPAGTCVTADSQHMTNWRTFDQIILSSGFLKNGWHFVGSGVEILSGLSPQGSSLTWSDLSDHYPVMCNLKRALI